MEDEDQVPPTPPPPKSADSETKKNVTRLTELSPVDCKPETTVLPTLDEVMRKRAYIKEVLTEGSSDMREPKNDEHYRTRLYYDKHPETTRSLDFLKTYPQIQVAGRNPLRIPHDEILTAMDGFTNMQLAHEIAINHDFRLEAYTPPDNSLEERVRTQMKKAYWDLFDEALSARKPNPNHAISVFREIKKMLLNLLLPHNRHMRSKIVEFLDDDVMYDEVKNHTLDLEKYSDFVIETMGQLCCPMRDRQVFDLKKLEKPSEIFKKILETMEHMQLDMANFLISQVRPSIITNCVEYERFKFSQFMEMEYRLHEDALRVTRSWILRHRLDERCPLTIIGRAFAEVLLWKEADWPETLTLDWNRCIALAEETNRMSYLGAAVNCAFNAARPIFREDDPNISPMERSNLHFLRCYPLRDTLSMQLNILIQKEDCADEKKLEHVMGLLAEQAIKITEHMALDMEKRSITPKEKDLIQKSVMDCSRENNPIRRLLIRRLQEYVTELVAMGVVEHVTFPKALACIEEQALHVSLELHRIAMHNRAVFQELYQAIIANECCAPVFINKNNEQWDPNFVKAINILRSEHKKRLILTRDAENEKLEGVPDHDDTVVDTTPEIERMIDKIIEAANVQDDYDFYANVKTEEEAVRLVHKLFSPDDETIRRLMTVEAESNQRIAEKKKKMREKLRQQLKADLGMAIFEKKGMKDPDLKKYCKLLRVYAQEEAAAIKQEAAAAAKQEAASSVQISRKK